MDRLPPRPLSIPELVKRHFELQQEFDDHRVAVMLALRDLEEKVADLTQGMKYRDEQTSEVVISAHPGRGDYRATLRAVPAWAVVVIIAIAGATVAYACSSPHQPETGLLESYLRDRLKK